MVGLISAIPIILFLDLLLILRIAKNGGRNHITPKIHEKIQLKLCKKLVSTLKLDRLFCPTSGNVAVSVYMHH